MQQLVSGIVIIAIAAALAFYGTQLAREGWTKVFPGKPIEQSSAVTRPYVIVASTELVVPQDPSKPIQVNFNLKNSGQTGANGQFTDFTYYFSIKPEQREFSYQSSDATSFSLAPSEQWRGHFFPTFLLSVEKLKALNSGAARLFVYAKGEYHDSSGKRYSLPFARMYHPSVAGHLAMPPDDIVFK
ncbi:MAG: hypothetical protein ABI451_03920 [Dokdonella sp.]